VAIGIRINHEYADLVSNFEDSVVFQFIDGGADGGGADIEGFAQEILRRQTVAGFQLMVADVTDQQLFRLFGFSLGSHLFCYSFAREIGESRFVNTFSEKSVFFHDFILYFSLMFLYLLLTSF